MDPLAASPTTGYSMNWFIGSHWRSEMSERDLGRRGFVQRMVLATGGLALVGPMMRLAAQSQFLTSVRLGGFDLFYEVHGGGPAVVFAHGAGGTHMSWWQQVPVFSQQFRCITSPWLRILPGRRERTGARGLCRRPARSSGQLGHRTSLAGRAVDGWKNGLGLCGQVSRACRGAGDV